MSIPERMQKLIDRLYASGLVQAGDLRGCSAEEIRALEAKYELVLPESYRLFLETMGHRAGKFGSACEAILYPMVFEGTAQERGASRYRPPNPGWFLRLLDRLSEMVDRLQEWTGKRPKDDPFKLPPHLLVIYTDRSGLPEHWVIRCQGGDDSPVYRYDYEGDRMELLKQFDSFFDFMEMLREETEGKPLEPRHQA